MTDQLLNTLLDTPKKKIVIAVDVLLAISITITSYNKWIAKIDLSEVTDWENQITSGSYILFFIWIICLAFIYLLFKFLLIHAIPKSAVALQLFLKICVPHEYKQSLLTVYYRASEAGKVHLNHALEFVQEDNIELSEKRKEMLIMIAGMLLKSIILISIMISDYQNLSLFIAISGLVICSVALIYIILNLTVIKGKNVLSGIINAPSKKV